jgi:hypothetical protein
MKKVSGNGNIQRLQTTVHISDFDPIKFTIIYNKYFKWTYRQ